MNRSKFINALGEGAEDRKRIARKAFARLVEILGRKTNDEIIAEVEKYPKCGECEDCRRDNSTLTVSQERESER